MTAMEPLPPLAPTSIDESALEVLEDTDPERAVEIPKWEIESLAHAEVLMRRLRRLRHRENDVKAQANDWRAPIDEWERAALARLAGPIERYTDQLKTYAILQREYDQRNKTLRVPSGEVPTRRDSGPKISIDDPDAVVEWACNQLGGAEFDEVIETSFSVKATAMKNRLEIHPTPDPWCRTCGCELVEPPDGIVGDLSAFRHLDPATDADHAAAPGERLAVIYRKPRDDEPDVELEIPGVSASKPKTTATAVKPYP